MITVIEFMVHLLIVVCIWYSLVAKMQKGKWIKSACLVASAVGYTVAAKGVSWPLLVCIGLLVVLAYSQARTLPLPQEVVAE